MASAPALINRRSVLTATGSAALAFAALGPAKAIPLDESQSAVGGQADREASIAALDVSPGLIEVIIAHCIAYNELGHASRAADAVAVPPCEADAFAAARLDDISDRERHLFMAICRYPTSNDAERHDKAGYLLAFCDRDELEQEHIIAILRSMVASPDLSPSVQS